MEKPEPNSPECNHHRTLVCGQCLCQKAYSGQHYQIHSMNSGNDNYCHSGLNAPVCSGRGICEESFCVCNMHENLDEKNILGTFVFDRQTKTGEFYTGTFCSKKIKLFFWNLTKTFILTCHQVWQSVATLQWKTWKPKLMCLPLSVKWWAATTVVFSSSLFLVVTWQ